jgi:hypothetical protein
MKMEMTADNTPWYRQGWPWFLIAVPATAVIGGAVTFYLAARGWDGPVVQDYYKQGLAINTEIARAARAVELGIVAEVTLEGLSAGDRLRVQVQAAQTLPPEAALQLRLAHPGRRDADRVAVLARAAVADDQRSATYVGAWSSGAETATPTRPVAWQAVIETREWRLDDSFTAAGGGAFTLRAR